MRSSGNLINLTQPFMTDETFEIKPVQNLFERRLFVKYILYKKKLRNIPCLFILCLNLC